MLETIKIYIIIVLSCCGNETCIMAENLYLIE